MATSLIEAAKAWEMDKTLLQEPLIPRPIIFGEIFAPDKKKYDSPFLLTVQKKVESPKLKWPKFPELKTEEEKEFLVFKQTGLENIAWRTSNDFSVEGKMRNEFNTYGCITVPSYMERDAKNKFGGGAAVTPDLFKKIMRNIGVTIEHVYSGYCHVDYAKPGTIHMFPKKLFAHMTSKLREVNYAYEYVLAHEIIHATGAAKRLNRSTIAANVPVLDYASYREEECIAIIGSAKLLSSLGYKMSSKMLERHKNILANWSEGNNGRLQRAEEKAEEAVNYLLTGEIKWYNRVLNKLMKT